MKYILLALALTGCTTTHTYDVKCTVAGAVVFHEILIKRPGSCYEDRYGYCINVPDIACDINQLN